MSTLGQDLGTAALLLFCALTLIIRARHFCSYGKEALFLIVLYVLGTAPLRIATSHGTVDPESARAVSGYFAICCLAIQATNVWLGELTYRKAKEDAACPRSLPHKHNVE